MTLIVENLTKIYKKHKAIDSISFKANPGEIVGFLGPNGAGKSTTMKIITGFISQTSGNVSICGYDTLKNRYETKKFIGYLPEHNPLYLDLYIKEYLNFCASLYRIGALKRRSLIEDVVEKTGLVFEMNKKIGQLSKGYRQRVGLASALLHDPAVLILDEPTTGLDPNQIVEIRKLIKRLSLDKTVILSTHLMQEVEELCNKVVIIHKGKIVADDSLENLKYKNIQGKIRVEVEFEDDVNLPNELSNFYDEIRVEGKGKFKFYTKDDKILKEQILKLSKENNYVIHTIRTEPIELEEIFRNLTQT
jgi:ABC-2 type transport system ATP-binding protein